MVGYVGECQTAVWVVKNKHLQRRVNTAQCISCSIDNYYMVEFSLSLVRHDTSLSIYICNSDKKQSKGFEEQRFEEQNDTVKWRATLSCARG